MPHNFPKGYWESLSTEEQLANIGSEVFRAMKWKTKNPEFSVLAQDRALELFDLSLTKNKSQAHLRELSRARELWLDFFAGENQYQQTEKMWTNYFDYFASFVNAKKI